VLALFAALTVAVLPHTTQGVAAQSHAASLPTRAVLVVGDSLGGVSVGDTQTRVRAVWGSDYERCEPCAAPTWFYFARDDHNPTGAAVEFGPSGRAVAVFTLGAPAGWRTREGLLLGEGLDKATSVYRGWTGFKVCRGYAAMSTRDRDTVTSIYVHGEIVYGFALTVPGEPVCR
jgi:hypothetical protein